MAIKKVAKRSSKKKAAAAVNISVTLQAFSKEMNLSTRRGTTVGNFIKDNLPPQWDAEAMDASVNGAVKTGDYILNDGDVVQFVPKVTGGK